MKRIILLLVIFLLMGCVWADGFANVTIEGNTFEIPQQYSSGSVERSRYVYKDLATFAILCVDDYIVSNYGGFYDIADFKQSSYIGNRPVMFLTVYSNRYNDNNASYLYFPVNKSVYCISFNGNEIDENISHIVETAPESDMTSDTFYGLLNEAYKEHENRQYLDTLTDDDSYYIEKTNQHQTRNNDQLVKWYLLTHR